MRPNQLRMRRPIRRLCGKTLQLPENITVESWQARNNFSRLNILLNIKQCRLAFVDLETTGGTAAEDRITEIGIIEVDENGVREWSSLVNPQMRIPPFIQSLTGISDAMVENAPAFAELADEIHARLADRVFIAHNARFDHGFLKNEFERIGHEFQPSVLCTVRLSRKLFPGFARHNLDSIVERHGLHVSERHRALGDARLIWQFWQKILELHPPELIDQTVSKLIGAPILPPRLDALQLESLPATHGVYLFYGENDVPLYVGKAANLRQRVLSHFSGDRASGKEKELNQQIVRIEWREVAGELHALLQEATLARTLKPKQGHRPASNEEVCSWRLLSRNGKLQPVLARADDLFFSHDPQLYGLFCDQSKAKTALKSIARAHELCPLLLGLERPRSGKPCSASEADRCRGACTGKESIASHNERVAAALQSLRLQPWPYRGPIGIREKDALHIIDAWAYLGTAKSEQEAAALLGKGRQRFDRELYQIMQTWLPRLGERIVEL
jgi:DNA polymerase-3 subunit epsilon